MHTRYAKTYFLPLLPFLFTGMLIKPLVENGQFKSSGISNNPKKTISLSWWLFKTKDSDEMNSYDCLNRNGEQLGSGAHYRNERIKKWMFWKNI